MSYIHKSNKSQIVLLFIVSVLMWFSLFVSLPLLPVYLEGKVDTLAMVGMVLSMYGLAQLVVRIPTGLVADATGKHRLILITYFFLLGIGSLLLLYGNSLAVLMVGRTMTGIGAAAWVIMVAVFTNLFPSERIVASTALVTIANGLGKAISTLLTGFLTELGGAELVFYTAAAAAVISIILLFFIRFDETPRANITLSGIVKLLSRRQVVLSTIGHGAAMVALWAVIFSFLPVQAKVLGAGEIEISVIMFLNLAAYTVSNYINTRLGLHITIRQRLLITSVMFSMGNIGAAFGYALWVLYAAATISGLGFGMLQSTCIGYSLYGIGKDQRSSALGFHQALYSLGIFVGPWIGGVLADAVGLRMMFGIISGVCFLVLLAVVRATRE